MRGRHIPCGRPAASDSVQPLASASRAAFLTADAGCASRSVRSAALRKSPFGMRRRLLTTSSPSTTSAEWRSAHSTSALAVSASARSPRAMTTRNRTSACGWCRACRSFAPYSSAFIACTGVPQTGQTAASGEILEKHVAQSPGRSGDVSVDARSLQAFIDSAALRGTAGVISRQAITGNSIPGKNDNPGHETTASCLHTRHAIRLARDGERRRLRPANPRAKLCTVEVGLSTSREMAYLP